MIFIVFFIILMVWGGFQLYTTDVKRNLSGLRDAIIKIGISIICLILWFMCVM